MVCASVIRLVAECLRGGLIFVTNDYHMLCPHFQKAGNVERDMEELFEKLMAASLNAQESAERVSIYIFVLN